MKPDGRRLPVQASTRYATNELSRSIPQANLAIVGSQQAPVWLIELCFTRYLANVPRTQAPYDSNSVQLMNARPGKLSTSCSVSSTWIPEVRQVISISSSRAESRTEIPQKIAM